MGLKLEDKKITQLRVAKGVSRQDLAAAIFSSVDNINKVEKGLTQYSDDQLRHAKIFFDIEDMPLSEFECATARERLYVMRDYARGNRLEEAIVICEEMAKLVNLEPCDNELPMLYRSLEITVLIIAGKYDVAEEKLNYLQGRWGDLAAVHRYYFYRNMGQLNARRGKYEEGLKYYEMALDLYESSENGFQDCNEMLHYGLAYCCTYLEYPYRAVYHLIKIRENYSGRRTAQISLWYDNILAFNYIKAGIIKESSKLLNNGLMRAKSIKNDVFTGAVMRNLGLLHKKTENWKEAIKWFDQAMSTSTKDSNIYLSALYHKIICLAESKQFSKASELLDKSHSLYCANKVFLPLFESLFHYIKVRNRISVYNDQSVKDLETKAIPHLIKNHDHFLAIDYYKLLELYYEGKNNKKSLLASKEIRRIYERCLMYQR